MAARLGAEPDDHLVRVVHDRSAGNPFFVVELVRLLGTRRRLAAAEQTAAHEVPEGVRDVLRRRIAGLPEQTQAVLLVAAVVGREFDLDVVRDVSGLDDDTALDAIEAALLSGLVVEDAAVGRFRFTHALVREAIYDDVSRVRQARLHARVAEHLGDGAGAHWWLAAPVVGTGSALPHLLAAADHALAALAHEEAAEHLRHALELLAAEPASTDRHTVRARRAAPARHPVRSAGRLPVGHRTGGGHTRPRTGRGTGRRPGDDRGLPDPVRGRGGPRRTRARPASWPTGW